MGLEQGKSFLTKVFICIGTVIVVMIVAFIIWTEVVLRTSTVRLSALPKNFPNDISIYRLSDASEIVYSPIEKKGRRGYPLNKPTCASYVDEPDVELVGITWKNLQASSNDLQSFYQKVLNELGIDSVTSSGPVLIKGCNQRYSLRTFSHDNPESSGIDFFNIVIQYRVQPPVLRPRAD